MEKMDKWLFKIMIIGSILFCSGLAMSAGTQTYDNDKFLVLDGLILRRDSIDYAYKTYDQYKVNSTGPEVYHINMPGVTMRYKTKEERDTKFSILLRKLNLTEQARVE